MGMMSPDFTSKTCQAQLASLNVDPTGLARIFYVR